MAILTKEPEQGEVNKNGQEIIGDVFQDSNIRLGTRINMQMRLRSNCQNLLILHMILIAILLTTAAVGVGLLVIRNKSEFSTAHNCFVNEPCQNGGTCVNTTNSYSCACPEEFAGNNCQYVNECSYPGTCESPPAVGICGRCRDGFAKDPEDDTRCKSANSNASLIISSWEDIRMISLDGQNTTQIIQKNDNVRGTDYNFRSRTIFWFSGSYKKIYMAKINTESGKIGIFHDYLSRIDGVAVDWIHRYLYWVDAGRKSICVSNFNGNMKKVLFNDGFLYPTSIVVNPLNGWMYWSDQEENRIERAGLDGSRREVILSTNLKYHRGLVVDFVDSRLYWSQGMDPSSIWSSEFDGSDPKLIFTPNPSQFSLSYFFKVATFDQYVYFIEYLSKTIYRVSKCNVNELKMIYKSELYVTDIKIYDATLQPEGENLCSKRIVRCSHFCFPVPSPGNGTVSTTTCACPDGRRLSAADQQNCV